MSNTKPRTISEKGTLKVSINVATDGKILKEPKPAQPVQRHRTPKP